MWALLAACLQQQLGDGCVVGHDGNVKRRQTLTVRRIEVQLIGRELVEEDLHCVQVLLLHSLEETLTALHGLREKQAHDSKEQSLPEYKPDKNEVLDLNPLGSPDQSTQSCF